MVVSTPEVLNSPAVVQAVLEEKSFRDRMRKVRGLGPCSELALEFKGSAEKLLRTSPREAEECARLGALVARRLEDEDLLVACLRLQSQAATQRGAYRQALRAAERAARLRPSFEDDGLAADLEALRLPALVHLGRYEEARKTGKLALASFIAREDLGGAVRTRMALADLAFRMDRPRAALRHYSELDRILPEKTPPTLRGAIAANRGNSLEACHRFRGASRQFELARDIFSSGGHDHTVAQIAYNAAYSEMLRGRYAEALRGLADTEPAFRELDDERHLAHTQLDRAEIFILLNRPDEADRCAAAAEEAFGTQGLEKEAAEAAELAGRTAELSGSLEAAEAHYLRAERAYVELGLDERLFRCRVNLAQVAERRGQLDLARSLGDKAEAVPRDTEDPLSLVSLELLRARLDFAAGDEDAAIDRAEGVLATCHRIHAPWVVMEAEWVIARARASQWKDAAAIRAYYRALDALEGYRGGVPGDEFMASFLAARSLLYEELVRLLIDAGEVESAFEIVERARSRALHDLLAGRHGSTRGATGPVDDPRTQYLRERLASAYGKLFRMSRSGSGLEAISAVRQEAAALEHRLASRIRELRLAHPETSALEPASIPTASELRSRLRPGTVLLEYYWTDDALGIFVVSPDGVRAVWHPIRREELDELLDKFDVHIARMRRPLATGNDLVMRATRANLDRIAEILIGPVARWLGKRRMVIVPHGNLHNFPFHALPWEDGWLADAFDITYAPSASIHAACCRPRPPAPGPAALFGLPDKTAPRIEEELTQIAGEMDGARMHLGPKATYGRLKSAALYSRILHVATHGLLRRSEPMLSSLRFADGWVTAYELSRMSIRSELVVLAACNTGTTWASAGDELLGLTRAFLLAGAPAVLSAGWEVDDEATTHLMSSFYRSLGRGRDAAAAIREAMADTRETYPHPFHWAPFFLTGSARTEWTGGGNIP